MAQRPGSSPPVILLALFFILSGAAGLIYESVWARYISLLVGHSAYAQVIVLVIFLGGMAIGSLLTAKWSERIRAPLLWYALAEALIGLVATQFHGLFVAVTRSAYEHWLPSLTPGLAITAAMWSISALLILPQSILLGATFPLMTAGAIRYRPGRTGTWLGVLYFANSFGAAIGALVEGFVLIGAFGLAGTLRTAAWLNALVAIGILIAFVRPSQVFRKSADGPPSNETPGALAMHATAPAEHTTPLPHLRAVLLGLSFATALSSFFYEIAWTRMLSLVHGSATHSFELMLSAFVLGLALGSLWISRRADRLSDPIATLARLQWAMGVAAIATLPLYVLSFDWTATLLTTLQSTDGAYRVYSVVRYGMTLVIMLPATFCAGTTLPLITRTLLASGSGERAIGAVYGVNTIGSIVGAGIAALVLVPLIGLKWVLIAGGLIDIVAGAALFFWNDRSRREPDRQPSRIWVSGAATAVVVAGLVVISPFTPARMASGVYRYAAVMPANLYRYYFYRDGRTASVSVRQETDDTTGLFTISTNGKPDASVSPEWIRPYDPTLPTLPLDQDMSTQMFLPILALAHSPHGKVGAVIGQGSGITSHMLLGSPSVERLHTIEIEPEMIHGSRLFYPGNRRVFDDRRSTFENDDARAFLAATGPRFDFVVSEPSNPWVSGVSSLFTVEFYQRVRSRLQPSGIFVQWFHLYEIDDVTVSSVLASIDRAFPSYRVYLSSNADIIIVAGAATQLQDPDWSVTSMPAIAADLRRFPPLVRETFDAAELGGRCALHGYLTHAAVNSDFEPILDLNGERLRFRKDFATGFRELGEMRFDIPAAIENRRRGFGSLEVNPTPEIYRPAALTQGMMLRAARENPALAATWTDDSLRQAALQLETFDQHLAAAMPPLDWSQWVTQFVQAEAEIHGGTAGVADKRFYESVRRFIEATKAPPTIRFTVDFYHGLAAWDFAEAARAGNLLMIERNAERTGISLETLRQGTALSKLKLGDPAGARAVYAAVAKNTRQWTLPDRVLVGLIEDRLQSSAKHP
jgi:predicted membrane-bound spermidine synthase